MINSLYLRNKITDLQLFRILHKFYQNYTASTYQAVTFLLNWRKQESFIQLLPVTVISEYFHFSSQDLSGEDYKQVTMPTWGLRDRDKLENFSLVNTSELIESWLWCYQNLSTFVKNSILPKGPQETGMRTVDSPYSLILFFWIKLCIGSYLI